MGFQFNDHKIHLDLAGVGFDLEIDELLKGRAIEYADRLDKIYEKIQGMKGAEADKLKPIVEEACGDMTAAVDYILGEDGACKRIFGDRTVKYYDLCDLTKYISEEINRQGAGMGKTNRAARRASAKKK